MIWSSIRFAPMQLQTVQLYNLRICSISPFPLEQAVSRKTYVWEQIRKTSKE